MFEVNERFKAEDDQDDSTPLSYYHFVGYRWDIPIFFVAFDVMNEEMKGTLLLQAAGTVGLFAILKFHPEPDHKIRQIDVKLLNDHGQWVTKAIAAAYEGQLLRDGEKINGIKYICDDETEIYDPPEFSVVDSSLLNQCIHIQGKKNAS